jgi:hypothetical protein
MSITVCVLFAKSIKSNHGKDVYISFRLFHFFKLLDGFKNIWHIEIYIKLNAALYSQFTYMPIQQLLRVKLKTDRKECNLHESRQ